MPRLLSTSIALAVTVFVAAASMALIAAAWLMISYILNGLNLVSLPLI